MKAQIIKHSLTALAASAVLFVANAPAMAADLAGIVQSASHPVAGATVTLYAAGTGAPAQLAQGKTDANGAFKLTSSSAPANAMYYVVARGGTPKIAADKGPNDAIALLTVLGTSLPGKVTINEFTTIASVWTANQFLKGDILSGNPREFTSK